ncbi:hypothetical protein A2617_03925 [Candidatus Daviesbacteria bacterium RIFOXYD1_FULL_41_10]|uniref:Uncharacterized protein n=1 Tax=Candidatus Daviesbacteria bacterium RIFOXYD1_FULL_41_10 TaxID=1797801 RepID=A0A1F5N028_9BACT|nr:MAG: hypothetical protein A2617_03925 [Candidatus Daviesbacteria bacterium RIFOXYD1_FULL_41_10]
MENLFPGKSLICTGCIYRLDDVYPHEYSQCKRLVWTELGTFTPRLEADGDFISCDCYRPTLVASIKNWVGSKYTQLIQYGVPLSRI